MHHPIDFKLLGEKFGIFSKALSGIFDSFCKCSSVLKGFFPQTYNYIDCALTKKMPPRYAVYDTLTVRTLQYVTLKFLDVCGLRVNFQLPVYIILCLCFFLTND